MTELVLKGNVFEFNKEYFIQTSGTAIETNLAPGLANLFCIYIWTWHVRPASY